MPTPLEFVLRARNEAKAVLAEVGGQVDAAMSQAKASTSSFADTLTSAQTTLRNTGAVMSVAVTAPLVLLGDKAVDAASHLGESVNAVNVVFGDAASTIHDFAKDAVDEAGLSMRALNQAVTPIGAGLINMGLSADDAATASVDLAKRAADLASVYDVDVSEALAAIGAGLRGESEPLRRFGADLSDAAVRAKAVELGLAASTSEVDQAALAQARLAVLMEDTNKVAGDFVNTGDSLENTQRKNAQAAENTAAMYGEQLLPAKQALADATRGLIDLFAGLPVEMQTVVVGAGALVAGIGPLLLGLSQGIGLMKNLGGAMEWLNKHPIVLIVAGIAALVAALIWAYNNSKEFRDIVNAVFQRVAAVVGPVLGALMAGLDLTGAAFDGLGRIVGAVWSGITSTIKGSINFVIDLVNTFIRALNGIQIHIPGIETPFGTVAKFDWNGLNLRYVPRLDTGAWELLEDSLALVHRGEMVVPADTAGRVRESLEAGGAGRGTGAINVHNTIHGMEPGDVERETERALRRAGFAWLVGR